MWHARSPYIPVRRMYATLRSDGRPRPVIDLEPHYENTHYYFAVSLLYSYILPVICLIVRLDRRTALEGQRYQSGRLAGGERPSPKAALRS
jgi:hypothetical protein